ncbi:MAG: D-amino-acid transaminase [Rhodovibrionaceae bacterium]
MPRIAYVNGRYLPHGQAAVHIEDRGYQFSDGVYEVTPVSEGRLIDEDLHLDRLERSLRELRIAMPASRAAIKLVSQQVIRRNRLTNGFVYIQVTRGVAPRDHKFPKAATPALVMTARQMKPIAEEALDKGISVITIPDIRWKRRDIKSVSLLPNCLGKQQAYEQGAAEAWMVDEEGQVTEGTSTNAWIVTKDNKIVTRPASHDILNGITRMSLLRAAREHGLDYEERAFSVAEALEAKEAFITSSSNFVMPVTRIDDTVIGNGQAGEFSLDLRAKYKRLVVDGAPVSAHA